MIHIEKFKSSNKNIIENLIDENFDSFNKNFLDTFNKSSKLSKYALRKTLYFLKNEEKYVGYLWIERNFGNTIRILDVFIKLNYLQYLNFDGIDKLRGKTIVFEGLNNYLNATIMNMNNFSRAKSVKLLELNLKNKIYKKGENLDKDITFVNFNIGTDEKLRCDLQNDIFFNRERIPLKVSDILFEEEQDYYRNEFSKFMFYRGEPIGYGQIIYKNHHFLIVNFGIKEEMRKHGFGEKFINYLCNLGKESGVDSIYIQVQRDNFAALNLYKKVGFIDRGNIVTWLKE